MCTICTRSIPAMSKEAAWTRWWQWNIMSTALWNNASVRNMTVDRRWNRALMDPSRNCSLHKKDLAWRLYSLAELEKLVIHKKNLLWCYSAHLSMNGKFFGSLENNRFKSIISCWSAEAGCYALHIMRLSPVWQVSAPEKLGCKWQDE